MNQPSILHLVVNWKVFTIYHKMCQTKCTPTTVNIALTRLQHLCWAERTDNITADTSEQYTVTSMCRYSLLLTQMSSLETNIKTQDHGQGLITFTGGMTRNLHATKEIYTVILIKVLYYSTKHKVNKYCSFQGD